MVGGPQVRVGSVKPNRAKAPREITPVGLVFVNRRHSLSGIFSYSDNSSHWLPRRQTADQDEHTLCNVLRTNSGFLGFDSLLSYAHPAISYGAVFIFRTSAQPPAPVYPRQFQLYWYRNILLFPVDTAL